MADRIAHHVLDGAVQQLGIARHAGVAGLGDLHGPAAALGLERRILHDIVDDRDEIDRLAHDRGDSALHPGQHEQLTDQRVQTLGFPLDPVEGGLVVARPLAAETERDVETGLRLIPCSISATCCSVPPLASPSCRPREPSYD
ncbi:MAG: hypothetical protein DMF83_30195 [Acidobacteria bacterium]|nr:MAG: hypothetical protein DMF83_30195 [Acidobacteriota bacterium]